MRCSVSQKNKSWNKTSGVFFCGGGYWGESKAQLLQHTMMAFEEEHFVRSGQWCKVTFPILSSIFYTVIYIDWHVSVSTCCIAVCFYSISKSSKNIVFQIRKKIQELLPFLFNSIKLKCRWSAEFLNNFIIA
jgi:hypothetical protein